MAAALLIAGCGTANDIEDKVGETLSKMTLDEKIGQMVLFTSDWSVTGPSMRQGYLDDIRAGRCGNLLNAYTVGNTANGECL